MSPTCWLRTQLCQFPMLPKLPVFDEFLPISSKLDHLYRFSRNLALPMVVLILCLPPARWGHRALYSQCKSNMNMVTFLIKALLQLIKMTKTSRLSWFIFFFWARNCRVPFDVTAQNVTRVLSLPKMTF